MTAVSQRSFAGGELAPSCYARTDQAKYATGLRTCRNFIVQRHGGVTNRPGLKFIAAAKDHFTAKRLIPFVLDATDIDDTYVLELGQNYIRFVQDGGQVVTSGVSAWANAHAYAVGALATFSGVTYYCKTAHTSLTGTNKPGVDAGAATVWHTLTSAIYEIPTPWDAADLADLDYRQLGDTITIVHADYPPMRLERHGHTDWRLSQLSFGPSIDAPANVALASGGAVGNLTYFAVTAIKEGTFEESLPTIVSTTTKVPSSSTPTVIEWDSVAGAVSYNVYRSSDGKTYGLVQSSGGTPVTTADTAWSDATETVSLAVGDGDAYTAAAGQARNPLAGITAKLKSYDGRYTIKGRTTITVAPFALNQTTLCRLAIYYLRNTDTARVLWGYHYMDPVVSGVLGATVGALPLEVIIDVPDDGYSTLQIDVIPEASAYTLVTDLSGLFPPTTELGASAAVTFNVDFSGAAPYNRVEWQEGSTSFSDNGAAPDYSLGPMQQPALFKSANNFPSAVGFYQQRMLFGNSTNEPEKVWGSRTGIFENFAFSTPLQSDDAVIFQLAGQKVAAVKHFFELGRLLVMTTAGESIVKGDEAAGGVLAPDAINPEEFSGNGSGRLRPIKIGDAGIYVQGRGRIVRDLKPISAGGSYGGYEGTDLTVFAAHLMKGKSIVDWDFAQTPNSVVWAVRSDGVLLGLTYMREHAIWGWHRHDTDGEFKNVCVVPEGDEDAVYVLVERIIDGATKQYLERFSTRDFAEQDEMFFVDSGLSYDGWHTGETTMELTGGSAWDNEEQLTLTASAAAFTAGDVGNAVFLLRDDELVRCTIEAYTSTKIVTVRVDRTVPVAMREFAIGGDEGEWALAVDSVSGLGHIEGEPVSILADGYVVASPNNTAYTARTVSGGAITLDKPYAVIHVGLPYISDIETLDLDGPGPRTIKDRKVLVNRVGLFVEDTRGLWTGKATEPTDDDPLNGLQEYKGRDSEDDFDPIALKTDFIDINIETNWDSNGRILARQTEPLPATILSATPIGYLPQ